jgi:CubicO group peptidase (beta-lactamase class C family)
MKQVKAAILVVLSVLACWSAPATAQPAANTLTPKVDGVIDRALAEGRLVGAVVMVARDGDIVYQRAAGFADREAAHPMKVDNLFRLSSVSKPIVTAAAMVLIDRGRLSLEDPVSKWLPSFRPKLSDGKAPAISVRQLLTHTAGLGYKFAQKDDSPYHRVGVSDGFDDLRIDLSEEVRRLGDVPLFEQPGTAWRYSLAIDVLGAVIEQAAGQPLERALAELVTTPLGMRDTTFRVDAANSSRLAQAYINAKPTPTRMTDPQRVPFGGGALIYSPSRAFDAKAFPSGGAGMIGSAPNVLRLLEAVRKGGQPILSTATAASMMRDQLGSLVGPGPGNGFGFGGSIVVDPAAARTCQSAGTWSWGGVYGHTWFVDPARKVTVVALTNTALEGMAGKFPGEIRDAVCEAIPASR